MIVDIQKNLLIFFFPDKFWLEKSLQMFDGKFKENYHQEYNTVSIFLSSIIVTMTNNLKIYPLGL